MRWTAGARPLSPRNSSPARAVSGTGAGALRGRCAGLAEHTSTREELTQALRAVYLYVEKAGTGFGGFFRGLYGRGLGEAAGLPAEPAQAERYGRAGSNT